MTLEAEVVAWMAGVAGELADMGSPSETQAMVVPAVAAAVADATAVGLAAVAVAVPAATGSGVAVMAMATAAEPTATDSAVVRVEKVAVTVAQDDTAERADSWAVAVVAAGWAVRQATAVQREATGD